MASDYKVSGVYEMKVTANNAGEAKQRSEHILRLEGIDATAIEVEQDE